jgi:hypothetical protein
MGRMHFTFSIRFKWDGWTKAIHSRGGLSAFGSLGTPREALAKGKGDLRVGKRKRKRKRKGDCGVTCCVHCCFPNMYINVAEHAGCALVYNCRLLYRPGQLPGQRSLFPTLHCIGRDNCRGSVHW